MIYHSACLFTFHKPGILTRACKLLNFSLFYQKLFEDSNCLTFFVCIFFHGGQPFLFIIGIFL